MEKETKNKYKNTVIIICIFVLLLLIIFGAKAILYIRVLIGNDLVIKLDADKENLFLAHGESQKITITSNAISNIFCDTSCTSKFIDLSSGQIIEEDSFDIMKLPKIKEFTLTANDSGVGQKLYRFDLECNSKKTYLCATSGIAKKRTLLLTMNYEPTQEEKTIENEIGQNLSSDIGKINYYANYLHEFSLVTNKLNNTFEADILKNNISNTKNLLASSNLTSQRMINLWNSEDYFALNNEYPFFTSDLNNTENEFYGLFDSINSNLTAYNLLIDNLTNIKISLENLQQLNLTNNSSEKLDNIIGEFNNLTIILQKKDSIINKQQSVDYLLNKTQSFIPEYSNLSHPNINMSNITLTKIFLNIVNFSYFILPQQYAKCCYNNSCDKCCDSSCYNNSEKYPIIFIHGHSFNQAVSAEESLDSFEEMQRALENNGYIDAGSLYLSSSQDNVTGVWGKINLPLSIKTSYYFDILTNEGKDLIIQVKTDNLDTYTLRLREIINAVKYKTNRQKVIIISHSMGGLIARRYLQVFGEGDIDKLILIDTPNHGITGNTLNVCPVFGTKLECNDMDQSSLFMNKLNNGPPPSIPIYNIVGLGCDTNGEIGDGVVTNSSQYLEYAKNYYVNGTCIDSQFTYLHTEIIKPDEYPETLKLIGGFLNER